MNKGKNKGAISRIRVQVSKEYSRSVCYVLMLSVCGDREGQLLLAAINRVYMPIKTKTIDPNLIIIGR